MIDPLVIGAIRRQCAQLSASNEDELGQLAALVLSLCDGLADSANDQTTSLEHILTLFQTQHVRLARIEGLLEDLQLLDPP